MKKLKLGFLAAAMILSGNVVSQKILLLEGDFSFLKGQSTINIEYDFQDFGVGDYSSEADYKAKKVKELNDKAAGKGDKWSESWERDKTERFPQKFEELINKGTAAKGLTFKQNAKTEYTLIVKTTFIEPGFNVGVAKKPSAVSFEYIFVETNNRSNIKSRHSQKFVPGAQAMGFDYDTGTRISESYAKAGKMFAGTIVKGLK
jgi:hypothetical protein